MSTLESKAILLDVFYQADLVVKAPDMFILLGRKEYYRKSQSSNKPTGWCKKNLACIKVLHFFISREYKINIRNLNIDVRVRNSNKKIKDFQCSEQNFLLLYMNPI